MTWFSSANDFDRVVAMTFPDPSDDFRRRLTKPRQRRTLAGLPSDIDSSEQPVPAIGPSLQRGPRLRIRALHRGANDGVESRASLVSMASGAALTVRLVLPAFGSGSSGRGGTRRAAIFPGWAWRRPDQNEPGPGDPWPKAVDGVSRRSD
jgi:hypothetical protein